MPSSQNKTEGNDDQGFWGITILDALEKNFPLNFTTSEHTETNPCDSHADNADTKISWLTFAARVHDTMLARWDMSSCGGGLKWQIYPGMAGYTYKNSISNACLFHIAARLYRFTGNDTYLDTANLVWNWLYRDQIGLVQYHEDSNSYTIYDGAGTESNCTSVSVSDWSYNYG
ncbi:unnamed protein product [Ambrosiozyma monospora]|uniref:Unnamed protein product n=1 Tax=Ambrosiozyma monospora TaxID=43982 RepID=A0ACB5TYW2_AMBMO|nr:unnamed protein product [Ambrosiozyma monospora]